MRLIRSICLAFAVWLGTSGIVAAQLGTRTTPLPEGPYRIAGTVVSAAGGQQLVRARVSLIDTKDRQILATAITGENGQYEFDRVPAAKYSLLGGKRGFISANYDEHDQYSTSIVTGAGVDTEHLVLRLQPVAVLGGKVLDESGEPLRQATVTVYRESNRLGVSRVQAFRQVMTDDRGTYEITPLPPGTYFLSARATPWYAIHPRSERPQNPGEESLPSFLDHTLDVAYPITYYADVEDYEAATPIPTRGGDHPEIDIHLSPAPALHIRFQLTEDAQSRGIMPMLQQRSFDGMDRVSAGYAEMISPGVFEMTGVAAGRYTVRTQGKETGPVWSEVDLTHNGQVLDTASSQTTGNLKASVNISGGAKLPNELMVALLNEQHRVVSASMVDEKGIAELSNVTPGRYEVWSASRDKLYSVVSIISDGKAAAGHTLNVISGTIANVSLTLEDGAVDVEGFARRAGKPKAGAMVVLVPNPPKNNRELFRRDQSDLDGSFRLGNVVPGTYTVVAIENGWDLDWGEPGVIGHYARRGQAVVVDRAAGGSVHLKSPVEVQPR